MTDLAWERYRLALHRAMMPRANGTRHLDSCRNARVNSRWFPCSDPCTDAQAALREATIRAKPRTGRTQPAIRRVR